MQAKDTILARRLKELRQLSGMTQQELASHLGLNRNNYANYERGATVPPLETLTAMATEFSVTVDYLLGQEATGATSLLVRQTGDPLEGARLMGESNKEERQFLSLLRRMDAGEREKLYLYCYDLLTNSGADEKMLATLFPPQPYDSSTTDT